MATRTGKGDLSIGDEFGAISYEVGYCKPPTQTRFRKGQSGNPKGRRKGTKDLAASVIAAINETVIVNVNGKRKKISKLDAAVTQLVNDAARGDKKAIQSLFALVRDLEPETKTQDPLIIYSGVLAESDETV